MQSMEAFGLTRRLTKRADIWFIVFRGTLGGCMIFSSITFLLYFLPIVIIMNFALGFSRRLQNLWLLIASLFFYAWGEPVYVLVMMGSIICNWILGLFVGSFDEKKTVKKMFLILACILNLGNLVLFKYTGFLVDTLNSIIGEEWFTDPQIRLPIGISFYTFQAMSYVIDVYQKKAKVQKNLLNLGLYIAFFPQLIAGPIVRYTTVEKQIMNRKVNGDMFCAGICRFAEGLVKKILLANNLAIVADNIFGLTANGSTQIPVPMMLAWVGAIAYTLQLYYDFGSYSDMAIGLGMIFGFTFPENFRYPFISKSIKEFMARWHISLSAWFTQYVYKPLGGARDENEDKMIRNLFIVWLLTGIWHGANWTFIWWGLYFFLFIVVENLIQIEQIEGHDVWRRIYTIFAVIIAMVIFRCEDINQLTVFMSDMFLLSGSGIWSNTAVMFLKEYGIVFIMAIVCALPLRNYVEAAIENNKREKAIKCVYHGCYVIGMCALYIFCIAVLAKGGYNPFIYFNF